MGIPRTGGGYQCRSNKMLFRGLLGVSSLYQVLLPRDSDCTKDQFIPEHISTTPAPLPSGSPTPSVHKLLDREELNTVDDFIDNPEIDQTYDEADLGAMAEALPPAMFGWTSTIPTNETYASYNSTSYNAAADYEQPSYQPQWRSQNHQPVDYGHIFPSYLPSGRAFGPISSSQSIQPLIAFAPTPVSSTDRGLNPGQQNLPAPRTFDPSNSGDAADARSGLIHHNPVPVATFGGVSYTASGTAGLEFSAPGPPSSTVPIGPAVFNFHGPVPMNAGESTFNDGYQARFRPFSTAQSYQYGNDARFEPNGYVSLSDQGRIEDSESNQMDILKCLQRTDSVDNTRSSSPVPRRKSQRLSVQSLDSQQTLSRLSAHPVNNQNELKSPGSGSRKRQRSVSSSEDDSQHEVLPKSGRKSKKNAPERRKPRSPKNSTRENSSASDITPSKKPKPGRSNLSEGQKKENHTKAEQVRRSAIKQNLGELVRLVPGLENEKINKCQKIKRISDWLQGLYEANAKLTVKIKQSVGEEAFKEALEGDLHESHE